MITVLTGLPRAGKSYYAVSELLLPALQSGRRVLTNIEGLKTYKISSYIDKDISGYLTIEEFSASKLSEYLTNPDYAGFLIIVDEAHRFYPAGNKMDNTDVHALAVHGHNTKHSDGSVGEIDLILITQSPSSLHLEVLNRSAQNIKATNLRQLGASNKYKVSFYSDPKLYSKTRYDSSIHTYKQAIHDLYSSSSGGTSSKKSRSIFSSFKVLMMIPAIIVIIVTITLSYKKLQNITKKDGTNHDYTVELFLTESVRDKHHSHENKEGKETNEKNEQIPENSNLNNHLLSGRVICIQQFKGQCLKYFSK